MNNQYWEEDVHVRSLLVFVYIHLTVGLSPIATDYKDKKKTRF